MNNGTFSFLLDGAHWGFHDPNGFPQRILEHLHYSFLALAIAFLIAFPVGLVIGHTNRGAFLVVNIANAARSLPSLGVLMLVLVIIGVGLTPAIVALVVLAVPPILTATYAGVQSVADATVDAARGVGMTERQIITQVEVPNALPIIIGGVRNATLQVISTATIAAYVGLGGLGRYLFDGLALRDYPRVVAGAITIAVLAVVVDLLLARLQRALVSPGVDGRALRGPRRSAATTTAAPPVTEPA